MTFRAVIAPVVLVLAGAVYAQESRPAPENRPPRGNRPAVPASLGAAMRDMGQVWERVMKEAVDPAQKQAALADTILMERDAAIAKTGTPDNVRNLTGDARTKAVAEYRADMTKLLRSLLDLEDALDADKADTVKTLVDQIGQIAKAGHERFNPQ